ncbi:hypothetical protein ROHU_023958 [Labeo rohita]|uniref:Uncharacterized protein n=1 Tax=Labeo rohita TaxID=84645 RepID=A0A498MK67_LABRO|nr:hypothetical protein ROHU_023958 [Labeo rohita]
MPPLLWMPSQAPQVRSQSLPWSPDLPVCPALVVAYSALVGSGLVVSCSICSTVEVCSLALVALSFACSASSASLVVLLFSSCLVPYL